MSPPGDRREPPAHMKCPPAAAAQASEARLYIYIYCTQINRVLIVRIYIDINRVLVVRIYIQYPDKSIRPPQKPPYK